MNKKVMLLALAIVLAVGAAAYAHGGGFPGMGGSGNGEYYQGGCQRDGDERDAKGIGMYRGYRNADLPKDISVKMQELQRTNLEMRLALAQDKPDVNTARLLFGKTQKLHNELAKWRFEQYLETLSK